MLRRVRVGAETQGVTQTGLRHPKPALPEEDLLRVLRRQASKSWQNVCCMLGTLTRRGKVGFNIFLKQSLA